MRKYLPNSTNDLICRCAQTLDVSVDALLQDFESRMKPNIDDNYSRRLVEFCCSKAIEKICPNVGQKINEDESCNRFTFDMMVAWEKHGEDKHNCEESIAKENEDHSKEIREGNAGQMHDDIPLFYSDIMPLLVDTEHSVGEDAFVWLSSLFPLIADVVNARFTYETLTATTASRLHFPAYDKFMKEVTKCVRYLEKQATPAGVAFAQNEFVLHVDGTARTQRVVRHIGATSWPGRLTLTNVALYFEASGVISYENAVKIDFSRADVDDQVEATSTGPWGAPLFDKAISYKSKEMPEPLVLEFPEMLSSTRRDHWLALIKEVMLLHQFISRFSIDSPVQVWEIHSRTILGILRLHAAREMLRIAPPAPKNFLIFSLYEDLPKGDYVLVELANTSVQRTTISPCSATSVLKSLNILHPVVSDIEMKEECEKEPDSPNTLATLETTIDQVREEAREFNLAKATVEEMKEEGISDSLLVLLEIINSTKNKLPQVQRIVSWERPITTLFTLVTSLVIIYREWVGYSIAAVLASVVVFMLWARQHGTGFGDKNKGVIVCYSSDKTTVESIVAAQHSLKSLDEFVKTVNITALKIWSILDGKATKQANVAMLVLTSISVMLLILPLKYILIALISYIFITNSSLAKCLSNEQGNRRLREWWESIPIVPVRPVSSST